MAGVWTYEAGVVWADKPLVERVFGPTLQSNTTGSKWERIVWLALWVALIVATVGDGVTYWGISVPEPVGQFLWRFGFGVEILAMLVVLLATTMYGLVSMRIRVLPIWAAGLLTIVFPIGVATLA